MTKRDTRPGLANFAADEDEDDVPVPTPEQRAAARAGGERLGFRSEPAEPVKKVVPPRPATYTANFHIRTTPEDRERYDDFAYRHRIKKGEAMRLLLDLAEEAERAREMGK